MICRKRRIQGSTRSRIFTGKRPRVFDKKQEGESNVHSILWNLIYDKVKKNTDNVAYKLTREPDIVFTLEDDRTIAVEVEATRKSEKDLMSKRSNRTPEQTH